MVPGLDNSNETKSIVIACRFVPYDLWTVKRFESHYKISYIKHALIAKFLKLPEPSPPPLERPSSPITFAPDPRRRPPSPIEFVDMRRKAKRHLGENYDAGYEEDDEWDSEFDDDDEQFGSPRKPPAGGRIAPVAPQATSSVLPQTRLGHVARPSISSLNRQVRDKPKERDTPAPDGPPEKYPVEVEAYTLLRFTTGQILEDDSQLDWYHISPHELFELHGTVNTYPFPAPKPPVYIPPIELSLNMTPVQPPPSYYAQLGEYQPGQRVVTPLLRTYPRYAEPYWEGWVRALRMVSSEEMDLTSAALAFMIGKNEHPRTHKDPKKADPKKPMKKKLEWRLRWVVIQDGVLKVYKDRDDPKPSHRLPIADLNTLRGPEHLTHSSYALERRRAKEEKDKGLGWIRKGKEKEKGKMKEKEKEEDYTSEQRADFKAKYKFDPHFIPSSSLQVKMADLRIICARFSTPNRGLDAAEAELKARARAKHRAKSEYTSTGPSLATDTPAIHGSSSNANVSRRAGTYPIPRNGRDNFERPTGEWQGSPPKLSNAADIADSRLATEVTNATPNRNIRKASSAGQDLQTQTSQTTLVSYHVTTRQTTTPALDLHAMPSQATLVTSHGEKAPLQKSKGNTVASDSSDHHDWEPVLSNAIQQEGSLVSPEEPCFEHQDDAFVAQPGILSDVSDVSDTLSSPVFAHSADSDKDDILQPGNRIGYRYGPVGPPKWAVAAAEKRAEDERKKAEEEATIAIASPTKETPAAGSSSKDSTQTQRPVDSKLKNPLGEWIVLDLGAELAYSSFARILHQEGGAAVSSSFLQRKQPHKDTSRTVLPYPEWRMRILTQAMVAGGNVGKSLQSVLWDRRVVRIVPADGQSKDDDDDDDFGNELGCDTSKSREVIGPQKWGKTPLKKRPDIGFSGNSDSDEELRGDGDDKEEKQGDEDKDGDKDEDQEVHSHSSDGLDMSNSSDAISSEDEWAGWIYDVPRQINVKAAASLRHRARQASGHGNPSSVDWNNPLEGPIDVKEDRAKYHAKLKELEPRAFIHTTSKYLADMPDMPDFVRAAHLQMLETHPVSQYPIHSQLYHSTSMQLDQLRSSGTAHEAYRRASTPHLFADATLVHGTSKDNLLTKHSASFRSTSPPPFDFNFPSPSRSSTQPIVSGYSSDSKIPYEKRNIIHHSPSRMQSLTSMAASVQGPSSSTPLTSASGSATVGCTVTLKNDSNNKESKDRNERNAREKGRAKDNEDEVQAQKQAQGTKPSLTLQTSTSNSQQQERHAGSSIKSPRFKSFLKHVKSGSNLKLGG